MAKLTTKSDINVNSIYEPKTGPFIQVTVAYTNSGWQYDLNGNLLTDGTRNFAYDDENQLLAVWQAGGWSNSFAYDGKMRRRMTKQYSWSGTAWTLTNEVHYIYDGNLVVQERDGGNVPQVEYTRGTDLSGSLQGAGGIGGLLARSQDSQPPAPFYAAHSYYHADGNGNVTMLLYANGTVAAKYLYDPYGNTLAQSGPLAEANSYRFSSKEWNQNSGLYYYLYRFYDCNFQRWLNRDPIGAKGGLNLFTFAGNKSLNSVDYLGLRDREAFPRDFSEIYNVNKIKKATFDLYRDFQNFNKKGGGYKNALDGMCNGAKRFLDLLQQCAGPMTPAQQQAINLAKQAIDAFCPGGSCYEEAEEAELKRAIKRQMDRMSNEENPPPVIFPAPLLPELPEIIIIAV